MLYVCRVPAIVAIAILIMGAAVEQIHEVVRVHLLDLDDPVRDEVSGWNLVALYVLLYLLTWSILFWSEYAIAQRFSVALKRSAVLRFAFRGFPILLAAMPWVGAFLALRAAAIGLPDHLRVLAYVLCGVVVFFGVVSIATFFSRDVLKTIRRAGVAYRGDAAPPPSSRIRAFSSSGSCSASPFSSLPPSIPGCWASRSARSA